nr:Epimerase family protein SA0724 [Klebsiella pneumoniae]
MLISGSAIGYYGDLGEVVVTEEEPPHNEFTHKLCARWEQIACEAQSERTRVCLLRTGVVLAPRGGILGKMIPAFKLGLGGLSAMADSTARIHIDDMVNGILWLLDNDLRGPFNMVSPYPVHNEQFAHALGHALHRPAIFRVPAAAIRLLMGNPPSGARRPARAAKASGGRRLRLPLVRSGRSAKGCAELMADTGEHWLP